MQPDRTLVQLVSWVNLIEEENAKLLAALNAAIEKNKTAEGTIKVLREEAAKLLKDKALPKED